MRFTFAFSTAIGGSTTSGTLRTNAAVLHKLLNHSRLAKMGSYLAATTVRKQLLILGGTLRGVVVISPA